jgi:protein transport protein SEC24
MVVTDINEIYLPQPEDLIVNLSDSLDLVTSLLDSLPTLFAKTQIVDNCFVAALQAANLIVNPIGGRLILFQVA